MEMGFLDGYVTDSVIEPFGGKLERERGARPQEEPLFDVVLVWEPFRMRAAGSAGTAPLQKTL